jgi:predicted phage baseplate assembly protein
MTRLSPKLFDRRFDDLLQIGRARLPSLAPDWTDYNVHDPGITLMELLAWTAEAQMYSLSRMRRDERAAYAALLGLAPHGPVPAEGLVWPDRTSPGAASSTVRYSTVIGDDVAIHTTASSTPTYRSTCGIVWVAGDITAARSIAADGVVTDHTTANARGDVPYFPLGTTAGPRDVLRIEFACKDRLFPPNRADAAGAYLALGVRLAGTTGAAASDDDGAAERCAQTLLVATIEANATTYDVRLEDGTQGFKRSGVLLLDVSGIAQSPRSFAIVLRAPAGLPRPPRVLRIDLNVIPLRQGQHVRDEVFTATGLPDQTFDFAVPGLRFGAGVPQPAISVAEPSGGEAWNVRERLDECGPEDRVFALDPVRARLTLGNGINGRLPAPRAQVLVSYSTCDGAAGNASRNQRWRAASLSDVLGTNLDALTGGLDASTDLDLRREARTRIVEAHALVTAADIEAAARALPDHDVKRAHVVMPRSDAPDPRGTALIAIRNRPDGIEPAEPPETPRWLAEIERRLASRLPLGAPLRVRAPRYVTFGIRARIESVPGAAPADVKKAVMQTLRARLAVVAAKGAPAPRRFGQEVSLRDLTAWIRGTADVRRIASLRVTLDDGTVVSETVGVRPDGLTRAVLDESEIEVVRGRTTGGAP